MTEIIKVNKIAKCSTSFLHYARKSRQPIFKNQKMVKFPELKIKKKYNKKEGYINIRAILYHMFVNKNRLIIKFE